MRDHGVCLPYPDRQEPTVATCTAGDWTITYHWGGHDEAASSAAEHIEEATDTHPVEVGQLSGERFVMPGRSK